MKRNAKRSINEVMTNAYLRTEVAQLGSELINRNDEDCQEVNARLAVILDRAKEGLDPIVATYQVRRLRERLKRPLGLNNFLNRLINQ
jgi:hypothetical protein